MRDLLETLLEENFTIIENARRSTHRNDELAQAEKMIKVAIGIRRSGKTYLLYQVINQLLDQGVSKEQILFINFEDDRLLPMNAKTMGALLDAFYSLYPNNHQRRCYLFLDEVQNVDDWHLVVRRFHDSKNVQLYLTGSSAKLLSKEIHTSLRGRSLSIEVWPYSFREYLDTHHIQSPQKPFGQASVDMMQKHLQQYLLQGGFPAVQTMSQNERVETLQSYVDTVMLRDIIERYHVSNIPLLKYLINTLLKNAATIFSVHKFYNDIKSQGYKISKDTIHLYFSYIQDVFLVFTVPCYSESDRMKQSQPKKIYAIDSGLINAVSFSINNTHGKLFENLLYLDLRRQRKKIYFYTTKDGYEIDFMTIDQQGNRELIQAVWDTADQKTLAREERALAQAEKELSMTGRIISAREYLKNW